MLNMAQSQIICVDGAYAVRFYMSAFQVQVTYVKGSSP
jgi:hypothetical protein